MRTFSRAAVLLSTAALGGMLLSAPATDISAILAATTTQTTAAGFNLTDGTYKVNLNFYKTGTTTDSTMKGFMNPTGDLTVKNGNVTIDISTKTQQNMNMMQAFSIMGHDATKNGTHWTVTMPTSEWQATLHTHMIIDVPGVVHEEPDADLVIDTAHATKTSVDAPTMPAQPAIPALSPIDTKTPVSFETDAPITIDQGMGAWFKPTAHLAVKGDVTNVTLTFNDDKVGALKLIPYVQLDGKTQKIDGQSVTFTIPTKDLQPGDDNKVTLKSFTSVPMSPSKGYPANVSFDMTGIWSKMQPAAPTQPETPDLSPIDTTTPVSFEADAPITIDQGMGAWFKPAAHLAVKGDVTNVTLTFNDDKVSALKLIPYVQLDGKTQKIDGQSVTFTIPTKDLQPGDDNKVTLKSFTSVPMSPSKGYPANVSFDMTDIWSKMQPATPDPKPTQPTTPTKPTPKPTNQTLAEGIYSVPFNNYKTGTTEKSAMTTYLQSPAKVTIQNGQATLDITTNPDQPVMSMMSNYKLNGHLAKASGSHWIVTLPVADLAKTISTSMSIAVPGVINENPTADMKFNLADAKKIASIPTEQPTHKPQTKPETTPVTTPTKHQTQESDNHSELHALKILRGDSDADSIASQYFLSSIKLDKNADGSYTAYITSHTPKMMGKNPITFADEKHQATLVNTVDKGDAYESTFSLHLAANEINAAIATFIHVQFTSPISYNENYEIRLVIGKLLAAPSTTTGQTNTASSTNELVSHGTMTNLLHNGSSLMAAEPKATNELIQKLHTAAPMTVSPLDNAVTMSPAKMTTTTTTNPTKQVTDKKHSPMTKSVKEKQATVKTPTKQAVKQTTSAMQSPAKRAAIVGVGVALAAAIGFIGTTLIVNFFKGH